MTTYLTIMVTVLVATQVIRIIQNTISLYRQHKEVKKHIQWFDDRDISAEDFDVQRECFYMLWRKLKAEEESQREA